MELIGIATISFVCVASNHLGLISAIEKVLGFPILIFNCPRCFTFWATLIYCYGDVAIIDMVAISFLNAWFAIWLELGMGIIDKIYLWLYEKIYGEKNNKTTADTASCDTANPLP